MLAAAEAGKVSLLAEESAAEYADLDHADATWHKNFVGEFETFPGGENDDQIDTAAAGYNYLSGKKIFTASWGRRRPGPGTTAQKRNSQKIRQASFILSNRGRKIGHTFGRKRNQ